MSSRRNTSRTPSARRIATPLAHRSTRWIPTAVTAVCSLQQEVRSGVRRGHQMAPPSSSQAAAERLRRGAVYIVSRDGSQSRLLTAFNWVFADKLVWTGNTIYLDPGVFGVLIRIDATSSRRSEE